MCFFTLCLLATQQLNVASRKSCVLSPPVMVDNSWVVSIIAQVAIASQLLVVCSRKVASVRLTYEMNTLYFEQLLIVDNSQLKVASLRGYWSIQTPWQLRPSQLRPLPIQTPSIQTTPDSDPPPPIQTPTYSDPLDSDPPPIQTPAD